MSNRICEFEKPLMGNLMARDLRHLDQCIEYLEKTKSCSTVLPGARLSFKDSTCEEFFELFRECVVKTYVPTSEVERAWIASKVLVSTLNEVLPEIGGRGWILPRETGDFVKNPVEHLKKKILLYTYDLLRGKLDLDAYASKAKAALSSSLRSNMRSLYEIWVLATVLKHMINLSARLIYPEHGYVHFDRHGKQKAGTMPPNLVVSIPGRGMLTFYLEAPRPLGWGDLKDLKRVWRLYTILRPDIMVYSGLVFDIVNLESPDLPVARPNIIVECKELEDWFVRSRDLKGPVNPELSFHEWYRRWLSGLWIGLADVLGADARSVMDVVEGKRRSIRVTEVQLVRVYKSMYRPDKFFLVSSPRLPGDVVSELESSGIAVIDNVKMGCSDRLKDLAEEIIRYARPVHDEAGLNNLNLLKQSLVARGMHVGEVDVLRYALEFALSRIGEFADYVKTKQSSARLGTDHLSGEHLT